MNNDRCPQQAKDLLVNALANANLDPGSLEQLLRRRYDFEEALLSLIKLYSSREGTFPDEEGGQVGAFSDFQILPVDQQIARLRELFPDLDFGSADLGLVNQELPPGAKGWLAIPRWQLIDCTYAKAVAKILDLLGEKYSFKKGRRVKTLLVHPRTDDLLGNIERNQACSGLLVVPAQLGGRFLGSSSRRARALLETNEFALGAFAVGVVLLTHPEQIQSSDNWAIDCPGDSCYAPGNEEGDISSAPVFFYGEGLVRFDCSPIASKGDSGTATGFVL